MSSLIINKLYLFSIKEKKAKVVPFEKGINIITSKKTNGNNRGKSVIMKSIYHTLGAEAYFEDKWQSNDKVYILDINIDADNYYIYRSDKLFKIYNENFNLLFKTTDRKELATYLKSIFKFGVELPNRKEDKLEIATPVYNYLLNFIDQDKMDCSNFASFKNLAQYPNYKENVLYYHFGVLNSAYYEIKKELEKLNDNQKAYTKNKIFVSNMLDKIDNDLGKNDYSKDFKALTIELEKSKEEYYSITSQLNKVKSILIKLRNEKEELISSINELESAEIDIGKDIKVANENICPLCESNLNDNLNVRISKYNDLEDVMLLNIDLESSLGIIENKIVKEEENYREVLELLNKYEKKLNHNSSDIDEVIKVKGLIEVKNNLVVELGEIVQKLNKTNNEIEDMSKNLKVYNKLKNNINKKYYELMVDDKNTFDLKDINNTKFKNIKNTFIAGGSNIPISTVIWYFNLLRIKYEFNPTSVKFPLVLDSPNNTELDDENRFILFNYLFENIDEDTQLIVSTLGFDQTQYEDYTFNNIIKLENPKYELLNDTDYEKYKDFLKKFSLITKKVFKKKF